MKGLLGQPTLINNVETFANIPPIIRKGGDWYAQIGTEKSKGTKVFALAGRVQNTGLVEVPMGITFAKWCSRSAAAFRKARNSKRCRPEAPPAAASPPKFSICQWTTSRSPPRINHGLRRHDRHG